MELPPNLSPVLDGNNLSPERPWSIILQDLHQATSWIIERTQSGTFVVRNDAPYSAPRPMVRVHETAGSNIPHIHDNISSADESTTRDTVSSRLVSGVESPSPRLNRPIEEVRHIERQEAGGGQDYDDDPDRAETAAQETVTIAAPPVLMREEEVGGGDDGWMSASEGSPEDEPEATTSTTATLLSRLESHEREIEAFCSWSAAEMQRMEREMMNKATTASVISLSFEVTNNANAIRECQRIGTRLEDLEEDQATLQLDQNQKQDDLDTAQKLLEEVVDNLRGTTKKLEEDVGRDLQRIYRKLDRLTTVSDSSQQRRAFSELKDAFSDLSTRISMVERLMSGDSQSYSKGNPSFRGVTSSADTQGNLDRAGQQLDSDLLSSLRSEVADVREVMRESEVRNERLEKELADMRRAHEDLAASLAGRGRYSSSSQAVAARSQSGSPEPSRFAKYSRAPRPSVAGIEQR